MAADADAVAVVQVVQVVAVVLEDDAAVLEEVAAAEHPRPVDDVEGVGRRRRRQGRRVPRHHAHLQASRPRDHLRATKKHTKPQILTLQTDIHKMQPLPRWPSSCNRLEGWLSCKALHWSV